MATQCDMMLHPDHAQRHNEVARCIHLSLCIKYGTKAHPRVRIHSIQEIVVNENIDTRIRTAIKVDANRLESLFIIRNGTNRGENNKPRHIDDNRDREKEKVRCISK
ncbi:hypothetical protein PAEPH01_1537 [Pancytospora epiphaga]|nr:hypothetical protein PAEPH01_1537 [Pancytospora epiphaga]